jgi:hypothetical protein
MPGSGRLQGQPLEMGLAGVLGTLSALGRTQLIVGVDLALELVQHRLTGVGGSGGSVFGLSPRFMGCDLRAD